MNQKGMIPILGLLIAGVLLVTIFLLLKSRTNTNVIPSSLSQNPSIISAPQSSASSSADKDDLNEDQLSQYQIPSDVLVAMDEAKSTGNPVLGIRTDGPQFHIPILLYHYVEHVKDPKDKTRISLNTLPETLDKQIQTLVGANYNFITASDLANILDGIVQPPAKPVMLTFDDGYRDFYTDAYPILKKYKVKATAYVVSGFVNQPNNMTTDQLQEIVKGGLVEIGDHTVSHIALATLTAQRAKDEIENSKVALEKLLNIPVTDFAYPYGSFNLQAIQLAKEAGFRTAVSTVAGKDAGNAVRYFAYRVRPGAYTGQRLLSLIQ